MNNTPIKKALGAGEDFPLVSGAVLKVYPAKLVELEDLMPIWQTFLTTSVQGCFMPGRADQKKALEDLLLSANGKGQLRNPENEEDKQARSNALKEILTAFGDVSDECEEVYAFVKRFLGFIPRVAPDEEQQ